MDNMYSLSTRDNLSRDKRALDARALDMLMKAGQFETVKTRFGGEASVIPPRPIPLPTEVNLPDLPYDA